MSIIKVKKSASSWKGFTPYKTFSIKSTNNSVDYSKNKRKKSRLLTQKNVLSREKRFKDLYIYCKKSHQAPQSTYDFALEMKKLHVLNGVDYYEAIFKIFNNLIDGEKIAIIDISMVKDVKNLFIHIKEDYNIKTSRLAAKILLEYLGRIRIKTKKMNSLQRLCQEHLSM